MDKNKLILPISILLGSMILGGFYYASQISKQRSIEKQQQIELQNRAEADNIKREQEQLAEEEKQEQEKKEYIVKRKKDCYDLENSERKKWNNVVDSRYDETDDLCYVRYSDANGKTWSGTNCEDMSPSETDDSETKLYLWHQKTLCENKEFENSF